MSVQKPNIEFINPFITSTVTNMKTMLFTEVTREKLYLKQPGESKMAGDLSVMVSIFGDVSGTCVISFSRRIAIFLVNKMLGSDEFDDVNDEVLDALGEIGNLICGGAKSKIAQSMEKNAEISLPTVILGRDHQVIHSKGVYPVGCIFSCEEGKFALEVAVSKLDD